MKKIAFGNKEAQHLYEQYIKETERTCKILDDTDKKELLMEINSHIYEGLTRKTSGTELHNLQIILSALGKPSVYLKPYIAELKIKQAQQSFSPIPLFQAVVLNLRNSVKYLAMGVLSLLLIVFIIVLVGKLIFPDQVGLFISKDVLVLGAIDGDTPEVLGQWFFPFVISAILGIYALLHILLRVGKN